MYRTLVGARASCSSQVESGPTTVCGSESFFAEVSDVGVTSSMKTSSST
jgi:hypothetical protein